MNSTESESRQQLLIIKSSTFINLFSFISQFLYNNLICKSTGQFKRTQHRLKLAIGPIALNDVRRED